VSLQLHQCLGAIAGKQYFMFFKTPLELLLQTQVIFHDEEATDIFGGIHDHE
jgi:hypothetical protein